MRSRTPEELEEQARKLMLFNENESNKANGVKKILSDKISLVMIQLLLGFVVFFVFFYAFDYASSGNAFSMVDFISGFLQGALYMAFPIAFYVLSMQCYKIAKKPGGETEPYDSLNPYINRHNPGVMDKIAIIKRALMFFLIAYAVMGIMQSMTYINANTLKTTLESMLGYELTDEEINLMRLQGYNSLIKGVIAGLTAYAVSRSSRSFYETIVFDEKENQGIDLVILSSFIGLFGLLLLSGLILTYCGIVNPLVGVVYVKGSFNHIDLFYILSMVSCIGFFGLFVYTLLRVRKCLKTTSGTCGKPHLAEQIVYTIDGEDIDQ